ncbi:MAG: NUDIX hydrolase [Zoogloeaceae bacterium]|jgi:ADP-ribose pyrophosphatase|nr:NUDIX hydrolase [Zoogloeaceae bacterium]
MSLEETRITTEPVYSGRLLHVRKDTVCLPNGQHSTREYIEHPGAAVILARLPNGDILLERQFRYPLRQTFIELPAGKIDQGETPLSAAKRELREETGYAAADADWRELGAFYPCIGYSDEKISVFFVRNVHPEGGQQLDDNEFLEIFTWPPERLHEAVRNGEITDGKTLSTLLLAEAAGVFDSDC